MPDNTSTPLPDDPAPVAAAGSRVGTRKRKRAKGSPTWVGRIPISPALTAGTAGTPGHGHHSDLEKTQEQTRVLWNQLLGEALAAIARVKDRGSALMKILIAGIPAAAERSGAWRLYLVNNRVIKYYYS